MWTFAYVHIFFWALKALFLTPTVLNRHLCAAQLFRLYRRLWNVRSSAHVHVTDDVWSTAHVWSSAHVTLWSSRISLNDFAKWWWFAPTSFSWWFESPLLLEKYGEWHVMELPTCYVTSWRSDKDGPVLCSNAGTGIFCGVTQECVFFGVPYGALQYGTESNEFK